MFGESDMLGVSKVSVDKAKFRIYLPSFCDVSKGDQLVLVEKDECIEVWSKTDILSKLKEYRDKIQESTSLEMIKYYMMLDDLVTASISKVKTMNDRKFVIGVELARKYNICCGDMVVIEGKGNYIRIWTEDKYNEYESNLNKNSSKLRKLI